MINSRLSPIHIAVLLMVLHQTRSSEDGYVRYVKDGCFVKGEALSCVKYKALKIAKKSLFGDHMLSNETIKANQMFSFVPLDAETIEKLSVNDTNESSVSEPRSFMSEWAELTKYFVRLVKDFFKVKGLRVDLPDGARTVEEEEADDGKNLYINIIIMLCLIFYIIHTNTEVRVSFVYK